MKVMVVLPNGMVVTTPDVVIGERETLLVKVEQSNTATISVLQELASGGEQSADPMPSRPGTGHRPVVEDGSVNGQ